MPLFAGNYGAAISRDYNTMTKSARGCRPERVLNGFWGTRPGVAFPVGQTLGQTASFRQTAPETWCQSRVCGVSRSTSPKTVTHPIASHNRQAKHRLGTIGIEASMEQSSLLLGAAPGRQRSDQRAGL